MKDSLEDTGVAISKMINDHIEKDFLSIFKRTRKLYNDYWYVWIKSGVLEYLCAQLKEKYNIPDLDESTDYVCVEVPIDDSNSVSIDHFEYYDNWSRKNEFKKEVNKLLDDLRLPRTSFDSLFSRIFYCEPLSIIEKWQGINSAVTDFPFENGITKLSDVQMHIYTKKEVDKIESMIREYCHDKKISLTSELEIKLKNYKNELVRKTRTIQSIDLYVLAIKQMKNYKKHMWVDYQDDVESPDKTGNRQIAGKCATRIARDLDLDNFTHVAFRRLAGRLYKDFPILVDFVSSSK